MDWKGGKMNICIYGAGQNGQRVFGMLGDYFGEKICVKAFVDGIKQGDINGVPILKIDNIEDDDTVIIIALFDFKEATRVFLELNKRGYKNIWWFKTPKKILGRDFFDEQCISCEGWKEYMLEHVEMHIVDACNLNCRGCTHFSPIFEKEIPEFDRRIGDVKELANKQVHIVQFNILGGEPFLNPEIEKYVVECRKILPYTEIVIVTNGLLIPKIKDGVFETIRDNNVKISISEYRPTHQIIDKICDKLEKNSVIYNIRPFDTKEMFNKPLRIDTNAKYESLCISDGCINIWNGKISRCPTLMFVEEFNKKFSVDLPTEGIMLLENCPSGKQLIKELEKRVALCEHCIENKMDWSVCGREVSIHDFAVWSCVKI